MGAVITLSTDWGEALEEHRLRGQGKGNVLRVIDPQDGFVERWAVVVSCVRPPEHWRLNPCKNIALILAVLSSS